MKLKSTVTRMENSVRGLTNRFKQAENNTERISKIQDKSIEEQKEERMKKN